MTTYPYISGQAAVTAAINQLRKGFPPTFDAGYLKRFSIGSSNEGYVISIIRFLGLIDEDGKQIEDRSAYFYKGDSEFKEGLEAAVRDAYAPLFTEMPDALDADKETLTPWFRGADKTSELVGSRQATTFLALATLAGHGEVTASRPAPKKSASSAASAAKKAPAKKSPTKSTARVETTATGEEAAGKVSGSPNVGLSVRIEVNLPPSGDAETYDAIFASIKKHLMP